MSQCSPSTTTTTIIIIIIIIIIKALAILTVIPFGYVEW
jgi:hypothetical protein